MPKGLRCRYGLGHLHFITFSCYRRLPLLRSVRARNVFVEILGEVRDRLGFALVGYVVMPNHIHLLISEPARGTPSTVMQVLKQRMSWRLRRKGPAPAGQLNLKLGGDVISWRAPSRARALPQFWQPRLYDFNLWSQTKFVKKLQYMHMNPVKRKLVAHPRDWPWSSFSFYTKKESGLVRIDPLR